jgi:hypothetical protein
MLLNVDIINKIINDIAPKYFDDDFAELSKNRIGVFGMVAETMGTIYENSIVNNAIKAKEKLTITATKPTLIQEAASYPELTLPGAVPASINVSIGVPVSYLETKWAVDSSNIRFTLHKDSIITISGFTFMLPFTVNILGRKVNGNFSYSAQYTLDGENSISNITNPFLITQNLSIDSEKYLLFNTNLLQVRKKYDTYNITETERIPLQGIEFKYDDQLAYFNVFYRNNDNAEFIKVDKFYYTSKLTSENNKYLYYNDTEPGKIRLSIPAAFNFNFNGEIRVDMFTTKGKAANFTYNGGTIEISPESYLNTIDYTGSYFNMIIISNSLGGTDTLTTEEIRARVINYKSTLRSIDTENDLNRFFKNTDVVNNTIFIKKRIDIYEKKYTAFMIMRNVNGNVISTNSLDGVIKAADVNAYYPQTSRRIIYPSTAYSLIDGQNFKIAKNDTVYYKVKRIRLRLSGNTINNESNFRVLNVIDMYSNVLPRTAFTFTQGANHTGTIDLATGSIDNMFDGDPATFWTAGNTSALNDPTKFTEVIITMATPTLLSGITMATPYSDIRSYALGSVEVQYEDSAGTNANGSDGTWVSIINPRKFEVIATENIQGNTVNDFVPLKRNATLISSLEENANKFLFGCPYLMIINEDPPSISYYLNSINKEHTVSIAYSNTNAPLQFIINKFTISRNAIDNEFSYKINLNIVPTSALPNGIIDSSGNIIDVSMFKLFGYVYSATDANNIVGYFNMKIVSYNKNDNYFVVSAELKTDDYITLNDELRIKDSIYTEGSDLIYDHISPLNDVKIGIGIYYNDGNYTDKGTYNNVVPNMANYGLLNIYTNEFDKVTLMVNMTRLVQSIINYVPSGGSDMDFSVKQIPLIKYTELRADIDRVSNVIKNSNETLKIILNQIKNNSSIDFKFYATYGKSNYFRMENTVTSLDRLDIKMKFRVRMLSTRTDTTLVADLKAFIQPLIETINVSSMSINESIYFSNIITQVENEFKYKQSRILAFELRQINDFGLLYQSLINTTPSLDIMNKDQLLQYVPEFVKLDISKIDIEVIPV